MKIKEIRFFNAVKVGANEISFAANYDIPSLQTFIIELIPYLDFPLVKLTCLRTGASAYSSLYNATWFSEDDKKDEPARLNVLTGNGSTSETKATTRPVRKTK
jgi:hypothetical protein